MTDSGGAAAPSFVSPTGEFTRDQRYIATRITADGRDGYPVEPGRYRLIVSRACPWASRAVIIRRLLGLEEVLSMGIAGPTHDARSWTFDLDPGGRDPVLGIERLQEAYFARFPGYDRGITVPAIVDIPTGRVVTNDYAQMTLDFTTEWRAYHRPGAPELYPPELRAEIDEVAKVLFIDVNNGVYRCGFAGTQQAYDRAYHRLFDRLDWLSSAPWKQALPRRRHDHRSRYPVFYDSCALRPRLPRAFQVQPFQAERDAGALGLCPRPVSNPRVRRHGRLRSHQAALLPGPA